MADAYDLILKGATVVNHDGTGVRDIAVSNGRIAAISTAAEPVTGNAPDVIDCSGLHILPGVIDSQVHFREPGLTHKGDICSESRAAVAGGVTSYMEMPNTQPQTTTLDLLEEKYARAAAVSAGNFSFYLGATNDNLEEIKRIDNSRVCGLKVFMGSSTGNMLVDDEQTLRAIFSSAPCVITTHCESTPMINANLERAVALYGNRIPVSEHPQIRNRETCLVSSTLAVKLAKEYGSQLHILHLSTADELALLDKGPVAANTSRLRLVYITCILTALIMRSLAISSSAILL